MTIYIQPLKPGSFAKDIDFQPLWEGSWKIYNRVTDGHPAHNCTYEDLKIFDVPDLKVARLSFINFYKYTVSGEPFDKLFNPSQCHTGHEFDYHGSKRKIQRMWFGGDIRIYFYTMPEKEIVILKTLAKHSDTLNTKQANELESIAKSCIDCVDSKKIKYI